MSRRERLLPLLLCGLSGVQPAGSSSCQADDGDVDVMSAVQRPGVETLQVRGDGPHGPGSGGHGWPDIHPQSFSDVACGPECFLHAYPRQYVANKLGCREKITIDGSLDDAAWQEVPFSKDVWEDIAQPLFPGWVLPTEYATRFKIRWDHDFLYIGAEVGEPWLGGEVTGHNPTLSTPNPIGGIVPYYDNDFEVFVDVSGTNYYYKEFEMNYLNATYDVFWRVPDGSVPCSDSVASSWCVNTSATVYPGTWSMYPRMRTATAKTDGGWTLEIAFPLRASKAGGGLLDGGEGWERFDPNKGQLYWMLDFSRAEHPFFTGNRSLLTPLCTLVQQQDPTLLGTDQWSCYFDYVWQNVGGTKYMHNPELFGFLQFAPAKPVSSTRCMAVEWPARYILSQVWRVMTAYAADKGSYTTDVLSIVPTYCTVQNSCNAADLTAALTTYASTFNFRVEVDNAATSCVSYKPKNYTGGPCFTAHVDVALGGGALRVAGSVREDRYLDVPFIGDQRSASCLVAGGD